MVALRHVSVFDSCDRPDSDRLQEYAGNGKQIRKNTPSMQKACSPLLFHCLVALDFANMVACAARNWVVQLIYFITLVLLFFVLFAGDAVTLQ